MSLSIINLADNPNTPPEVLSELLDNESKENVNGKWYIWYDLVHNPNTPAEALNKLTDLCFKCAYYTIILQITKHPNTPTTTKQYIQTKLYLDYF